MVLINIYGTSPPKIAEYALFLHAHGTLTVTNGIVSHETEVKKLKKFEIIQSILFDHLELFFGFF